MAELNGLVNWIQVSQEGIFGDASFLYQDASINSISYSNLMRGTAGMTSDQGVLLWSRGYRLN